MKRIVLLAFLLAPLAPLPAARATEAVDALLWEAASPADLRARLQAFMAAAPESAVTGRGAAAYYIGVSFEQGGETDSARVWFERAVEIRGLAAERDALVDALLLRGTAEDGRRALALLAPRLAEVGLRAERDIAVTRGRRAWALYAAEQGDSAVVEMRANERWLLDERTPRHRDWRYRLALLELEHGSFQRTITLILPLAMASRFQDRDVMGILRDALRKDPTGGSGFTTAIQQELLAIDRLEQELLDTLGGKRVNFRGADGYGVSGLAFAARGRRPARAVVALLDHEEPFENWDSLTAGLTRSGHAVLLIEPRGSGRSVASSCPLPETWRGREAQMAGLVAGDIRAGLRALAATFPVDTSRYIVSGSGPMAAIAVRAAAADRRARPVLLFSPRVSPVERGEVRALLARTAAPVFFEVPTMDRVSLPEAEILYAVNPSRSRLVESEIIGQGAGVYRRDRSALPRLLQWLRENSGTAAPRGSRR